MECATTALPSRCVLVSGGLDFLGKGPFGAQNFLRLRRACGGSAHGTVAMDPGSETPPWASTPVTSQEVVAIPGPGMTVPRQGVHINHHVLQMKPPLKPGK